MGKEQFQNSLDFKVKSVKIWPAGNPTGNAVEINSTAVDFSYVESITSPFVAATLTILDSVGMLSGLPVQGSERIEITVQTSSQDDPVVYNLRVWSVANRYAKGQKQAYTLGLISGEGITNETLRITKPLNGKTDSIVTELLENFIKTDKPINTEISRFEMKMMPRRMRPFDIIAELCLKSVGEKGVSTTIVKNKRGRTTKETTETIKGSAGFFFWENKRGYNFFSVDTLLAEDGSQFKSDRYSSEAWGPYIERTANTDDVPEVDERSNILEASFGSQLNVMESLRLGKYGSMIAFFNHSTGEYEEYLYNAGENYDNMSHLGGQESTNLLENDGTDLTELPSRIMSVYIDHESWYNKGWPASPEDSNAKSPTPFADWQKYYAAQALTRYEFLKDQFATVQIAGNSGICAGDLVDLRLSNKMPTEVTKDEPFDKESSGLYLVEEVTHEYKKHENANGRFITTLRLMRDSYGMKDRISSHGK